MSLVRTLLIIIGSLIVALFLFFRVYPVELMYVLVLLFFILLAIRLIPMMPGLLDHRGYLMSENNRHSLAPIDRNTALQTNAQLDAAIQAIWDKHDPAMGNIVSWWRKRKVEGQNRFLQVANEQQRLLIERAAMISEAYAKDRQRKEEFIIFLQRSAAEISILVSAARAGMTVQDYSADNREEAQHYRQMERDRENHRMRMEEISAHLEIEEIRAQRERAAETERERRQHEMEMERQRVKQELELKARKKMYKQDNKDIDRLELVPTLLRDKKRKHLNKLYAERQQIIESKDPTAAYRLKMINLNIKALEDDLG